MRMDFRNKENHSNGVSMSTLNIVVLFAVLALTVTMMEVFGSNSVENSKAKKEAIALKAENELLRAENTRLRRQIMETILKE